MREEDKVQLPRTLKVLGAMAIASEGAMLGSYVTMDVVQLTRLDNSNLWPLKVWASHPD